MTELLADILVVIVAAKAAAELAVRVRVPAVVAEIVAGVIVGPSLLGAVHEQEVLRVLGELGVLLLLLDVGMQTDVRDLLSVGRASLAVAVVGVAVPMAGGAAAASALGVDAGEAVFVGAALTATSVGITARVFGDLRALASPEARVVLGAAVADDVLGLVILTVVVRAANEGGVSLGAVTWVIVLAVLFLAGSGWAGIRAAPHVFAQVERLSRSPGTLVALAFAFALAIAQLAAAARLAPIIGAFVAGLGLSRTRQAERVQRELTSVGHLFIPIFFLQIGIDADMGALLQPAPLTIAGVLAVIAALGKLVSGLGALGTPVDRLAVGLGMLPRGEVGLIFAGVGLQSGVLGEDTYAALLAVVLVTTLVTPPLLGARLRSLAPSAGDLGIPSVIEPDLSAHRAVLDVVRSGDVNTWRLLQWSGALEMAVPELASGMRARRADPMETDGRGLLRWPRLDAVRELMVTEHVEVDARDAVLVAALALDAGAGTDAAALARRLGLEPRVAAEARALADRDGLLHGAARRVRPIDEHGLLALAAHVGSEERLASLLVLALADEPDGARSVRGIHADLLDVLRHRDRAGLTASTVVAERLAAAAALVSGERARHRVLQTPHDHVLRHHPDDLARHAVLVDPAPRRGEPRVTVTALGGDMFRVEVAARDRPGLLARVTGVLADAGADVEEASAVTWSDGAALQSYRVRGFVPPRSRAIAEALGRSWSTPLRGAPVADATVHFDNAASPWRTVCRVEAPDRPGLLHTLAAAFASAGADVHAATVTTAEGRAVDDFELTNGRGAKLDTAQCDAVAALVRGGVSRRGSGLRRAQLARSRNKAVTVAKSRLRTVTRSREETQPGDHRRTA